METARPSWSEIREIVEEGPKHFAGRKPHEEWTAAEQLAVVLAPEVFGPKVRRLLAVAKAPLPEVEVIVAQDDDDTVLKAFADEVGVVGACETAERLLVWNGGIRVARILATSKALSGGAQMGIVRTMNGHSWDHWSRRMMLAYQGTIAQNVVDTLVNQLRYKRDDATSNRQSWDPVVARLLVETIRRNSNWAAYLGEEADRIEESLAEYTEDTRDDSWQSDEYLDQPPPGIRAAGAGLGRRKG